MMRPTVLGVNKCAKVGGWKSLRENGRDVGLEVREIGRAHDDAGYARLVRDVP